VDYSGAINFHELSHDCTSKLIISDKENHRSYRAIINPDITLPLTNLKPSKVIFYNLLFCSLSIAKITDFKDGLIDLSSLFNYLNSNSKYKKTLIDLNIDETNILPNESYINILKKNQIIVKSNNNYHTLIASEKAKDIIEQICQDYGENSINPLCDLITEIVTMYSNTILANSLLATNNDIIKSIHDSIILTNKDPNGKYSLNNQGLSDRKKYLITDGIVNVDNGIDNIEVSKASFTIIKNHISHKAPNENSYYEDMDTVDENITYNADEINVFTHDLFSENLSASLLASREIQSIDNFDKLLDKITILTEITQKIKHRNSKNILVGEYISAIKTIMSKTMSVTDENKKQYIVLTDKSVNLIKMWSTLLNNVQVQSLLNQLSSSQEQSCQLKKGLK
jgi:hypothetical protein